MSSEIGSFDAKTHLSEYLERASRGESFTITRRGVPLADLCPHKAGGGLTALLQECADLRVRIGADRPAFGIVEAVRADRDR
ncbi:MAG: type II toxin-antitoxin system prevent-host-death family antitoxin [Spirochaetaceae bacterium]|nr:MAG: type II toxin-antitoxin system prevent-host-death family antitoxin [Spirochaetaceae bacterium]